MDANTPRGKLNAKRKGKINWAPLAAVQDACSEYPTCPRIDQMLMIAPLPFQPSMCRIAAWTM
jgi:hypothetical protein